jgi:F-type H+-transporting ATPase subunit d
VSAHLKAIDAFETKAVRWLGNFYTSCITELQKVAKAEETAQQIEIELKDLQATLANIEEARPFEDLTVQFSAVLFVSAG